MIVRFPVLQNTEVRFLLAYRIGKRVKICAGKCTARISGIAVFVNGSFTVNCYAGIDIRINAVRSDTVLISYAYLHHLELLVLRYVFICPALAFLYLYGLLEIGCCVFAVIQLILIRRSVIIINVVVIILIVIITFRM